MADRPLESWGRHSFLDGLDHFTGIFALIVTAMLGLDIYFWLALNKPPKLSILWMPPLALRMWKRVVSGQDVRQLPPSWSVAFGAYSGVILAIVLFKGIRTSDDWWMAGFAILWVALCGWKATRREADR